MRIFASFKIAFRALRRNKMRTLLTMLGIIIGVGAVIAMVSLATGATKQVEAASPAWAKTSSWSFPATSPSGGMRGGWGSARTLTVEDALAIQTQFPHVRRRQPGSPHRRANHGQRH